MAKEYPVVTLCGSTRFKPEFEYAQKKLTLDGYIVISVGLFGHSGDDEVWERMDEGTVTQTKTMLDDMHKSKIDMADEIFVINPDGYIGDSTWSEICYARMTRKPIKSLVPIEECKIKRRVALHIQVAAWIAWRQLDWIRHQNGFYDINEFVHFQHKGKDIVDPWINVETHYDGTPWADHTDANMSVDPFKYYGKQKVARFIEEIIMKEMTLQKEGNGAMMCSIVCGTIKPDRLATWGKNRDPYDILEDTLPIHVGGWEFLDAADKALRDKTQVDWGSFSYKASKRELIALQDKLKCSIEGIEKLQDDVDYGVVFIEES